MWKAVHESQRLKHGPRRHWRGAVTVSKTKSEDRLDAWYDGSAICEASGLLREVAAPAAFVGVGLVFVGLLAGVMAGRDHERYISFNRQAYLNVGLNR